MERSVMRGGRAAWHDSRISLRSIRATCLRIHNVKQRSLLRSRGILASGFSSFLSPSSLPIPDRGDGGAPGGGILYSVARVIARRHVCEAWAVPRNRERASRRSTVTVLGPFRAFGSGVASGFVSAGDPCCRHRFRSAQGPEPPGHGLRTAAGTPPPAPPSGSSPETPLDEQDVRSVARSRKVVNIVI